MLNIFGLTADELSAAARFSMPTGHGIANALYPRVMRAGRFAPAEFPVSAATAATWCAQFEAPLLRVVTHVDEASVAGTTVAGTTVAGTTAAGTTAKAVFATHDGYEIEAVRIPMHVAADGTMEHTICISSQVGCKMGCTFCETGRMGLLRNLTAGEIVAQVVTARSVLGWQPKNIVFMGMGEALDNCDQVLQALRVLTDRRGLHFSQERITVCTSGHAEGIARLAALGWKRLNLSLSLNGATDELRSRIMPVNRKTPLAELQRILAAYPQRRNFTLGVNYCLLPGLNDTQADALHVAEFCRPLGRVLLNLIPYNPGNAPLTRAPTTEETDRFLGWLHDAGLPVRQRTTKGRTIMAACGQLGNIALRRARVPVDVSEQTRVASTGE